MAPDLAGGELISSCPARTGTLHAAPLRRDPTTVAVVGVAQLVEHLVVVQDVAGSSPVTHPNPSVRC